MNWTGHTLFHVMRKWQYFQINCVGLCVQCVTVPSLLCLENGFVSLSPSPVPSTHCVLTHRGTSTHPPLSTVHYRNHLLFTQAWSHYTVCFSMLDTWWLWAMLFTTSLYWENHQTAGMVMAFWKIIYSPITYTNFWILIAVTVQVVVFWDDALSSWWKYCLQVIEPWRWW
jgi:hypothetical protein